MEALGPAGDSAGRAPAPSLRSVGKWRRKTSTRTGFPRVTGRGRGRVGGVAGTSGHLWTSGHLAGVDLPGDSVPLQAQLADRRRRLLRAAAWLLLFALPLQSRDLGRRIGFLLLLRGQEQVRASPRDQDQSWPWPCAGHREGAAGFWQRRPWLKGPSHPAAVPWGEGSWGRRPRPLSGPCAGGGSVRGQAGSPPWGWRSLVQAGRWAEGLAWLWPQAHTGSASGALSAGGRGPLCPHWGRGRSTATGLLEPRSQCSRPAGPRPTTPSSDPPNSLATVEGLPCGHRPPEAPQHLLSERVNGRAESQAAGAGGAHKVLWGCSLGHFLVQPPASLLWAAGSLGSRGPTCLNVRGC